MQDVMYRWNILSYYQLVVSTFSYFLITFVKYKFCIPK